MDEKRLSVKRVSWIIERRRAGNHMEFTQLTKVPSRSWKGAYPEVGISQAVDWRNNVIAGVKKLRIARILRLKENAPHLAPP